MSDDPSPKGLGAGGAFPELELDLAPAKKRPAQELEEEPAEAALSIELAPAPVSARRPNPVPSGPPPAEVLSIPSAPPSAPRSGRGATSTPAGPPVPSSAPMPISIDPPPPPPPSAGQLLAARARAAARSAAEDPGAVARNVADVGNRTSTALVMLGGAILLTVLDLAYSRFTGERFSLGPVRLVWIAAPLALVGAGVLASRMLKGNAE